MPNLPLTIDSLDSIPADAKGYYKADKDGKYNLDAAELFSTLTAKEKALNNQRRVNDALEKEKKDLSQKFGSVDVDEYKKLRDKAKQWETEKEAKEREALEAKGNYEEALEKIKNTHSAEISSIKSDYDKKISELSERVENSESSKRDYILNDKIRRSIAKAGVFAEDIDDVLTLTKSRFDLDDKLNIIVKDESGNAIPTENIDNFFSKTFKEQKPKFYQGSSSSGSGSSASNNNTAANSNAELTSKEKIARGLEKRSS